MSESLFRDPVNVSDALERDRLIRKLRRVERKVQLDLNTIAHWNRTHPNEKPLDYDEDGRLAKACAEVGMDYAAMLRKAEGR